MPRARPILRLVCVDTEAATDHVQLLEKAGFAVHAGPAPTKQIGGHFRDLAPSVIVIDMDRLPSHGRAVAVVLRTTKSTRHLPIVFAGGEPEKVARSRAEMPDACFTDWKGAAKAIAKFLQNPLVNPIAPPGYMDQFAGSSTIKKLGFKAGMKIAMLGEPDGFVEQLGELPEGVEFSSKVDRKTQLALWFVRSRGELESEIAFMSARLPEGCSIWIVHPKQTSRIRSDFNQNDVRNAALLVGLVDYKVCSVDADWSGLKFARKKGSGSTRTEPPEGGSPPRVAAPRRNSDIETSWNSAASIRSAGIRFWVNSRWAVSCKTGLRLRTIIRYTPLGANTLP